MADEKKKKDVCAKEADTEKQAAVDAAAQEDAAKQDPAEAAADGSADPADSAGADGSADAADASDVQDGAEDDSADAETGADGADGDDAAASGSKEKSSFFKKKKDKRDEQIEDLTDKLRRQMAEFDNFRKRSEKEKSQMFDMGARTIIEKILPVVDNFERGLAMVSEEDKDNAFVTGMDKVYRQLVTELEAAGVTVIEAAGQEFDPNLHNAVMQVEDENLESGMVAQELQKGYKYKETVVRHSMVSVVQ